MKSSLAHLPEKNQFEINHIVEIIRDVVNPEMVILFGSYAKGKQVNHKYQNKDGTIHEYISDYDFLVVVREVTKDTSDQEWLIEERAELYEPPVNLEIHELGFINTGLETGQYFFTDIIKDGIILHNNGTIKFAEPRELSASEQRKIAFDHFQHWFNKGEEFLIDAANAIDRSSFKIAAFYLHQATENFYNTILLVFTGYKPKTHNIKKLRRKAKQFSAELYLVFLSEIDKQDKHLLELLKQGYIDARYKPSYNITEAEVTVIFQKVQKIKELVQKVTLSKIESI